MATETTQPGTPRGNSNGFESPKTPEDAALPQAPETRPDASAAVAERKIGLRGTHRSQLTIPKLTGAIKAPVKLPPRREKGSLAYLRQLLLTTAPLVLGDLAVLLGGIFCCSFVGLDWLIAADATSRATVWLPPVAAALLLLNAISGLYPGVRLGVVDEIRKLTLSYTIVALITAARLHPTQIKFGERLCFLILAYAVCVVAAPVVRSKLRRALAKTDWWGFPTLVCGHDTTVFSVCEWLDNNRRLGLRPIGVVTDPERLELDAETPRYIGPWEEARELANKHNAYWAVMVDSPDAETDRTRMVDQYLTNLPHVFVVSESTGMPDHWDRHQMDEGLSGFTIEQHLLLPVPQLVKRAMDLAIGIAAGIALSPLLIALAVAVKLTSKGPIFYGHKRIGRGNTRFMAWKFRTMCVDADKVLDQYLEKHPEFREEWERDHKLKNDPRVNSLGKFMRKWSLDELPQLWNVLRGDMSSVGPRPIVDAEIVKYGEHFETFCTVLPGMTGMWQVCGRNDTTYDERVQLDVYYVHHWSPWLDLYLLARTVKTVLFSRGAY
ncbi:MAG: undecaprenyl-phosphate galactose phosphotransferase WbaP [Planctomycetota bacterium]